jgi:hypothetical protein
MAKKLKKGVKVRVLRGTFAKQIGVVDGCTGEGRRKKWIVKFDNGQTECFASRTLEYEDVVHAPKERAGARTAASEAVSASDSEYSCASNNHSSEDDESSHSSSVDDEESQDGETGAPEARYVHFVLKIDFKFFSAPHASAPQSASTAVSADPNSVQIHGLKWEMVGDITEDVRAGSHIEPRIMHAPQPTASTTPLELFRLFFTESLLQNIISATNSQPDLAGIEISLQELLKFLGLILAMSQTPLSDRRDYWSNAESHLFGSPKFSSFMTRDRFELILKCLRVCDFDEAALRVRKIIFKYF